ncbi:MAG: hypothetical protein KC613_24110 [Myxococcales bacterium]|nr:hypothetical protein [Myxococcales bacterium]
MRHIAGAGQPSLVVNTVAAGWHPGGQSHCHHDWRSAEDQRGVLQALLDRIGPAQVDLVGHPRKLPHARRLALHFANGAKVTLWPDHGLGAFRTRGSQGYDFSKGVQDQAHYLARVDWAIAVKDDPTRVVVERG